MSNYQSKNYYETRMIGDSKIVENACIWKIHPYIFYKMMLRYWVVARWLFGGQILRSCTIIRVGFTTSLFRLSTWKSCLCDYLGKQQFQSKSYTNVDRLYELHTQSQWISMNANEAHNSRDVIFCLKALPSPRVTQLIPVLKPFSQMHNRQ